MALDPVPSVTGRAVFIPGADIDTDRIIPARFMKCVTFDGLGEFAFYDVRFDEHGNKTEHPLNDPRFSGASILVAGVNFGCGSSREHAPQSLRKYGFNGVIAESFAEIFYGNSTTLAMPCVMASAAGIVAIRDAVEADPAVEVTIDVKELKVRTSSGLDIPVTMPDSAREALLSGRWDPIQELLDNEKAIHSKARELNYIQQDGGFPFMAFDPSMILHAAIQETGCKGALAAVSVNGVVRTFSAGSIGANDHGRPFYIYATHYPGLKGAPFTLSLVLNKTLSQTPFALADEIVRSYLDGADL